MSEVEKKEAKAKSLVFTDTTHDQLEDGLHDAVTAVDRLYEQVGMLLGKHMMAHHGWKHYTLDLMQRVLATCQSELSIAQALIGDDEDRARVHALMHVEAPEDAATAHAWDEYNAKGWEGNPEGYARYKKFMSELPKVGDMNPDDSEGGHTD